LKHFVEEKLDHNKQLASTTPKFSFHAYGWSLGKKNPRAKNSAYSAIWMQKQKSNQMLNVDSIFISTYY
jgi:hypothetical protein